MVRLSHLRLGCLPSEASFVTTTPDVSLRLRLAHRLTGMLAVWVLVLAVLSPAPAGASASEEAAFINQVNAARAQVGLPALLPDVQLTNLARGWAGSMRDGACGADNYICHASPISAGVTHPWAKLGENVGTGPDVGSVMSAFIASPGHYANIVDPEFTHIGVGVVWDGNRMFTTHRFMKLQGASPTTTAAPTTTTAAPTTTQAPATTASPATTSAPSATPTTAAPDTDTTNDGGSPDRSSTANEEPADERALGVPARTRQPVAVLEERASVLIDALLITGP